MPVTLTCFSFVMKNKESSVDESVDSPISVILEPIVKVILNVFFLVADMLHLNSLEKTVV